VYYYCVYYEFLRDRRYFLTKPQMAGQGRKPSNI
jgi:hypothetical protein